MGGSGGMGGGCMGEGSSVSKALDESFRIVLEGVEKNYTEQISSYLDLTINNLINRMVLGEERITINETVSIANTLRRLLKDQAEAKEQDIVIHGNCPSVDADVKSPVPCPRCPKCRDAASMTDDELDTRIRFLKRHLDYNKVSGNPN